MPATIIDEQPAPRRFRIGGYRISGDVAARWASKLAGRKLYPTGDRCTIWKVILEKTLPFELNFRQVGEVAGVHWMLISQGAEFDGYKDMDPAKIPQFRPNDRDAHAKRLLQEAGIKEYEFATVLD